MTETTPYATIAGLSADKLDKKAYPLAVFKKNGNSYTLIDVYATWKSAADVAVANDGSVIYFRADVDRPAGEVGRNLDGIKASFTVDLNNKTLTKADKYIFDIYLNATTTNTHVTFKNGTMAQSACNDDWRAFTQFNYGTNHTVADAVINFTFENVKFKDNRTRAVTDSTGFIFAVAGSSGDLKQTKSIITYNNCEFYTNGTRIFDAYDNNHAANVDITFNINGGKIISSDNLTKDKIFRNSASGDSLTFGKGTNGYTTVELTNGATMDTEAVWNTAEGIDCVFVNDGKGTYTLYPKVLTTYKISTSVTLYSNFVYNIYIPKDKVESFTVNASELPFKEVEINGTIYYHTAVELPANETLSDIVLIVKLYSGDTTVDAKWTLNILSYAKAIINGSYDEVSKTLMKDMLSYASAAHTYFKNTADVEDKLAEVDNILKDYTKELPMGTSKQPTKDKYFTGVSVYLGEVPSFRFYLEENYTADDFTFTVGDNQVEVIEGEGYVEIVMYAYMMLEDVTFTVKGTNISESYNLYSYHDFATDSENEDSSTELVSIVEALMKYSASAAAYRDSIVNN